MSRSKTALGLDFGTNSVRALLAEVRTGEEIASALWDYPHGEAGVLLDPADPHVARQHPQDYLEGLEQAVKLALANAADRGVAPDSVIGIGIDSTGSTPLPVDADGWPLAFQPRFARDLNAMAWLWKDHASIAEAEEISERGKTLRPEYIVQCGGAYSPEWYWAKVLHCARHAPEVFDAAHTWVECTDWVCGLLTGKLRPDVLVRGRNAAGQKAMFNERWGGYPDAAFLAKLDTRLVGLRETLPAKAYPLWEKAGVLCEAWARKLGLPPGIPVSPGALDGRTGTIGAGIRERMLVKNLGTSCCDMTVVPLARGPLDIAGLTAYVPESILPGFWGLEAGQAAVGDIFNWFVNYVAPDGKGHAELTAGAGRLRPGESGLLALDWHNGNRTILLDPRLSGLLVGMSLQSTPEELYRAWIEATAFGARVIVDNLEQHDVPIDTIRVCGGIAAKNALVMQVYADVLGRPIEVSRSAQTAALGSAMAGAVVAGKGAGGYDSFEDAIVAMTGVGKRYEPIPAHQMVYDRLYALYRQLHDAFGRAESTGDLYGVMKELIRTRDEVRQN